MPEMISEVMRQEHARLLGLLSKLMIALGDQSKDSNKAFLDLKVNLEKHFKIEEEAIFSAYGDKVEVNQKVIHLIEEHKQMVNMLRDFGVQIEGGEYPDFSEFQKMMTEHQNKEDDYFYTGLERNLNEDQKADVMIKVKEMINAIGSG